MQSHLYEYSLTFSGSDAAGQINRVIIKVLIFVIICPKKTPRIPT